MDITIDDNIPIHKISYWLGILIGMGIPYSIDKKSPLYRIMREHKLEMYREKELFKKTIPFDEYGFRVVLSKGDEADMKLSYRREQYGEAFPMRVEKDPQSWRGKHKLSDGILEQRLKNKERVPPKMVNGHDLIILGRGPSKEGCPFDVETWATLSILEDEDWVDKPYSKLFCVERIALHMQPWEPLRIAHERNIPVVGDKRYSWVTEEWEQYKVKKHFASIFYLNAMSHMIALALHRGYKSLWLWGVDQTNEYDGIMFENWVKPDDMYVVSRHYVTYWLGVATGMGVKWEMCPNSQLWRDSGRTVADIPDVLPRVVRGVTRKNIVSGTEFKY